MATKDPRGSKMRMLIALVALVALGGFAVWVNLQEPTPVVEPWAPAGPIEFADDVQTNLQAPKNILDLEFVDAAGKGVTLKDLTGKKNLVLAVMRGQNYSGAACPFCSTQSARLIANYKDFQDRDSEVVILFPVEKQGDLTVLKRYQAEVAKQLNQGSWSTPFPLLLDVELKATNSLGIRGELAKPSTYIFDKKGQVRFAYVGRTSADRPSIKAMLKELDGINAQSNKAS